MSSGLRHKVAVFLLMVYMPVTLTLGLQHHDGPLYAPPSGLPVTVVHTNIHGIAASSPDGYCMACHFASGHIFEQPFHIFSAIHDIAFLAAFKQHRRKQTPVHDNRKRGPPFVSMS